MAVFTPVDAATLEPWLAQYELGTLVSLEGIASGIENSNFFLDTSRGRFVLTIFEKLTSAELPFYLGLTEHLSQHGIPCPGPERSRSGAAFLPLKGKPAAIVKRLNGRSNMRPDAAACAQVGATLARMHLAGLSFPLTQENPRGPHWWAITAPQVMPFLSATSAALLSDELKFQASHRHDTLPRGPIHADLFRDNVLFDGTTLGGLIDFYFAGCDCLLFDLAVCVNDWCLLHEGDAYGELDHVLVRAFVGAYEKVRALTAEEHAAWPVMLRAGALRFWLSRLFDLHLPRAGQVTPHDPGHFERILNARRQDTVGMAA